MEVIFFKKGDVFGPEGIVEGITLEVTITSEEAATILSAYDPSSSTSPSASISRSIARILLDKIGECYVNI